MTTRDAFPGTPQHQKLLRAITALYADDARVMAVVVFGSLGRGTWDADSDLDLTVIVRDEAQVDVPAEVARVCAAFTALGESIAFTDVVGEDGYIALQSLMEVPVEYRRLAGITEYVSQGCVVLCGSLDPVAMRKSAEANREPQLPIGQRLHQTLWLALLADVALRRGRPWSALRTLERMRGNLLEIYTDSRGRTRPYRFFDATASAEVQRKFVRCLPVIEANAPAVSAPALTAAWFALLDLIEQDLDEWSNGQLRLTAEEREFLGQLRARRITG